MEEIIRDLRKTLDLYLMLLRPSVLNSSREISITKTSLKLSRMHLGKVLEFMGTPNPYPQSMNPEDKRIEPLSDSAEDVFKSPFESIPENQISRVKELRRLIQIEIDKMDKPLSMEWVITDMNLRDKLRQISLHFHSAYINLTEAKMWLGAELGRIRDELKWIENDCPTRPAPQPIPLT